MDTKTNFVLVCSLVKPHTGHQRGNIFVVFPLFDDTWRVYTLGHFGTLQIDAAQTENKDMGMCVVYPFSCQHQKEYIYMVAIDF